jgi:hypothetical protein
MRQGGHEVLDPEPPGGLAEVMKAASEPMTVQRHMEIRSHWQAAIRVLEYQLTCASGPDSSVAVLPRMLTDVHWEAAAEEGQVD